MARARFGSRLGFVIAAAGSAIGLANIWRFPYIVGHHGGASFLFVYLGFLLLIGLPVFAAEVLIGRHTHLNPAGAFAKLGGTGLWRSAGHVTLATGLLVSSFYSVVAGWVLGYVYQAFSGQLLELSTVDLAATHFDAFCANGLETLLFHTLFMAASGFILYFGVQKGLERGNKLLLPLLFLMLLFLLIYSLSLPDSSLGVRFLLEPDWSALTPMAMVTALGHAFFTLSLGQGTMVTYGSYLRGDENILSTISWAVAMDTVVSLSAAFIVFAIVFSTGFEPDSGPGLLFATLPAVFSKLQAGQWIGAAFFLLVLLAALTSQISAMEPSIAYLRDRWGWSRHKSVSSIALAAWLMGAPIALSTGPLSGLQLFGMNLLGLISSLANDLLIPAGGLFAVLLVGWRWGKAGALKELFQGLPPAWQESRWVKSYFWLCLKFIAPLLIVLIFLQVTGLLTL